MSAEEHTHVPPMTGEKKKKRDQSLDLVANLENKLGKVRIDVGEILDWKETVEKFVGDISDTSDGLKDAIGVMKEEVLEMVNTIRSEFREKLGALEAEVKLCKAALAGGAGTLIVPRVEAPKPTKYEGKRDPKILDEFFWSVECYFNATRIKDDKTKIDTAVLYLSENAALWWRRKHGEIEKGLCKMDSWGEFKRQLKRQFCPHNATEMAMKKLRGMKQMGSIKDYVADFTALMLELPDLREEDKLFYFQDGLQSWAYNELKRRNVLNIDEAIAAAEDLIDFRRETPTQELSGGEESTNEGKEDRARSSNPKGKAFERRNSKDERGEIKCYLCDGPHLVRVCPKRKVFSSMVLEKEEGEGAHMSSMRLLNTLSKGGTKTHETKGGSLMFVEAKVCGRNTKALVDSGATHSFMAEDEARKLGIPYVEEKGWLKVVNSPYNPILGIARGLPMKIADWEGTIDVIVVPMDDYRMVLGMDFLNKVHPWTIERDNTMRITKGSTIYIVPLERSRTKSRILSMLKYEEGHMTGARPRSDADLTKEGTPPKSSIGQDYPEATRRKYAKGKTKEKSDGGHVAQRRTRASRNLDEDVKGLSGGECHGRKFQTVPRHSRSQQTSWDDSGRVRNNQGCSIRSEKPLEYYGASWLGTEGSRTSRRVLDEVAKGRKKPERPRTRWSIRDRLG
ncbi:hypothetical protein LXL04_018928 [Taraxacum kok-saghyz]